ncbi:hypothetical protein B279_07555 [Streptococcus equinus ATCC 33317]|uniref:acyltransferase n=1 Tax=Streptococcus TaxID=1301 RepID=UPI000503BE75|nr:MULTISPECIES: acyltransferase [Streptococcus]KFN85835.1 hypothetical protein B279_07555 [Streptococcus equinus ATCC 33317]MBM6697772.1 acyltransferase [Streptococcus alactolyticus]
MRLVNLYERLKSKYQFLKFKVIFGNRLILSKGVFTRKNLTVTASEHAKIIIGSDVFFNTGCSINSRSMIKIGDDCLFGENVKFYDHNHIYENKKQPIRSQGFKCKDIIIGNNCWFGSNVVILPGTTIGNHCVVGANCIVYGNLQDDTLLMTDGKVMYKKIKMER